MPAIFKVAVVKVSEKGEVEICKDPPEAENGFGTTERGSGAGLLQEMGSGKVVGRGWLALKRSR